MSSILFALGVAAFLMVAYWAYQNDRARPSLGAKGLLRMKPDSTAEPEASAPEPKWKSAAALGQYEDDVASARRENLTRFKPRWKR